MTVYFNKNKYQQLGFMHLKVDVIIFSRNESVFDFSRLRTTIYNWKNKRSLNSHKRYLSFKNAIFFPSTLLEAPTIPLTIFLSVSSLMTHQATLFKQKNVESVATQNSYIE
jgi:hypothetical protein